MKLLRSKPLVLFEVYHHLTSLFLGEGSFGNVYLVRRISDGHLYALKKVSHQHPTACRQLVRSLKIA